MFISLSQKGRPLRGKKTRKESISSHFIPRKCREDEKKLAWRNPRDAVAASVRSSNFVRKSFILSRGAGKTHDRIGMCGWKCSSVFWDKAIFVFQRDVYVSVAALSPPLEPIRIKTPNKHCGAFMQTIILIRHSSAVCVLSDRRRLKYHTVYIHPFILYKHTYIPSAFILTSFDFHLVWDIPSSLPGLTVHPRFQLDFSFCFSNFGSGFFSHLLF